MGSKRADGLTATIVAMALWLLSASLLAHAAEAIEPLFADDSALEMEFDVDFSKICRNPKSGKCEELPAVIHYTNDDGSRVSLDVRVRTRGRWRSDTSNCALPTLFILFDKAQTGGTVFENQTVLPFTTHCRFYSSIYQGYAMLEYLAHRYYNLLTDASLRVRLTRTTFSNTAGRERSRRYGFFVEHFDSAASRIGAERVELDPLDPRKADATELALLSTFQYMIGNLDWSVVRSHNIALFRTPGGGIRAIPFDFDYSGLVNAEYATPPDAVHAHSVLDRKYRGFCRPEIRWDEVFAAFASARTDISRLLDEIPGVTNKQRREAGLYLKSFFARIDSARNRQRYIIDECRSMPPPGAPEASN